MTLDSGTIKQEQGVSEDDKRVVRRRIRSASKRNPQLFRSKTALSLHQSLFIFDL